jgi:hypothetical protein
MGVFWFVWRVKDPDATEESATNPKSHTMVEEDKKTPMFYGQYDLKTSVSASGDNRADQSVVGVSQQGPPGRSCGPRQAMIEAFEAVTEPLSFPPMGPSVGRFSTFLVRDIDPMQRAIDILETCVGVDYEQRSEHKIKGVYYDEATFEVCGFRIYFWAPDEDDADSTAQVELHRRHGDAAAFANLSFRDKWLHTEDVCAPRPAFMSTEPDDQLLAHLEAMATSKYVDMALNGLSALATYCHDTKSVPKTSMVPSAASDHPAVAWLGLQLMILQPGPLTARARDPELAKRLEWLRYHRDLVRMLKSR